MSSLTAPLHLLLQGGSAFSPALLQAPSSSRRQALQLATELGCATSDLSNTDEVVACLRAAPVHALNAAQTKVSTSSPPCIRDGPGSHLSHRFCAAAPGSQRPVPVLDSGPSVGLPVVLPQSRPAAGNVGTRRSDQSSAQDKGQRSQCPCTPKVLEAEP